MSTLVPTRQNAQQRADPNRSATPQPSHIATSVASPIVRLQRAVGNRALNSLLRSPIIQPKLQSMERNRRMCDDFPPANFWPPPA